MAKESISSALPGVKKTVSGRAPALSLHDAYSLSIAQKQQEGARQLDFAVSVYEAHKAGGRSALLPKPVSLRQAARQADALNYLTKQVDAALQDKEATPKAYHAAVRAGYRGMIEHFGVEQIVPGAPGGGVRYDEWFKLYRKSFPISGERETKADMRDFLSTPLTDAGYGEVAAGLRDPLTGKYVGGVQGLIVSEARAGMFTYAFLDPAYQGMGLSRSLVNTLRATVEQVNARANPGDKRDTVIYLEKNKISGMALENILLDSANINVLSPPRSRGSLAQGAISQSLRDSIWSSLGALELKNIGYIQPSLDGVTAVENPQDRALAIRSLQKDATLKPAEREAGAKVIRNALDGKAEHCPLALCAFLPPGTTHVDARQTTQFLNAFIGTSCLGTDAAGMKKDIFAQATMDKLRRQTTPDGKLAVSEIEPYGGPIAVRDFAEAEEVTRALLKVAPLAEVQKAARDARAGKPAVEYGQWLKRYAAQVQAVCGLPMKKPEAAVIKHVAPVTQNVKALRSDL